MFFDIVGFKEQFTNDLFYRVPSKIFIFEPLTKYAFQILKRFK